MKKIKPNIHEQAMKTIKVANDVTSTIVNLIRSYKEMKIASEDCTKAIKAFQEAKEKLDNLNMGNIVVPIPDKPMICPECQEIQCDDDCPRLIIRNGGWIDESNELTKEQEESIGFRHEKKDLTNNNLPFDYESDQS